MLLTVNALLVLHGVADGFVVR